MICKKCQKEIDDDSKFCEFCGNKLVENTKDIAHRIIKTEHKEDKLRFYTKNTILIFSVLMVTSFFLENYFGDNGLILSIPATILIIFIYNKIAKKFNL